MIKAIIKGYRLNRIANVLEKCSQTALDFASITKTSEKRQAAEDKLFELVLTDEQTGEVLFSHGGNRKTLEALFSTLMRTGAGQRVKGVHVATAALAYPYSLDFLLSYFDGENFKYEDYDTSNSNALVIYTIIKWFKMGGGRPVNVRELTDY